jgi:hypothetical protein
LVDGSVGEERLFGEQPLAPGNSSVSQVTRMQREKGRKRNLNTMMGTSNEGDTFLRKAGLMSDNNNYSISG